MKMVKFAFMDQPYPKLYFYRRIVQVKLFIDQHYAENITLDAISDAAHFSRFHFIRQFKAVYQRTPHQYLIFVRIENTCKLLAGGLPVAAVCQAGGFEEQNSFSWLFKRRLGINPSACQLQQLASIKSMP